MCKAREIHCRISNCCRPIGWYVMQPCMPFTRANLGMPLAYDGSRDLNWNTSTSDCGVPRVVSTKKSTSRSCQPCCLEALFSEFSFMQDWAYVAKSHRKWLEESPGDSLLWRRTKTRLRREYDEAQLRGKKRKRMDESVALPTPPLSRESSQQETRPAPSAYPSMVGPQSCYPTPPVEFIDIECLDPSKLTIHPPTSSAASPSEQD
ncbi:uncharacterized protein TRIREDRAFT_105176 [Trichoderma reesei QM6a]|uniref:Predicted protein n=2 Tax=Hypocrea jecorina TaxID=51453 RepID=G0RDX3_HYPJQ|nr:uncharacterized protein TRIREDRAFT_105176 [Trichoderma reesei QM6a]EGR50751.1 predicted protein [Trichoderma reesei QM6a]ETS05810.1 hypothetical protein M419DRAFT_70383 [Trichoderma reesei RUT C-30]